MKRIALVLGFVILNLFQNLIFAQAPNWVWARSGSSFQTGAGSVANEGESVTTDNSGNVYVTGKVNTSTLVFGNDSINGSAGTFMLTKYDANGNVLWARGGVGFCVPLDVTTDKLGNVIVCGSFYYNVGFDSITLYGNSMLSMFIVKFDSYGNTIWAKSASSGGGDFARSIATDGFGNICMTGVIGTPWITFGSILVQNNFFVTKYDSNGNVIWAKGTVNNAGGDGHSVAIDINNDIYITGQCNPWGQIIFDTDTLNLPGEIFVVKYNSSGNALWARASICNGGAGEGITVFGNSVYVVGWFINHIYIGTDTLVSGSYSPFIIKYDDNGNYEWLKGGSSTSGPSFRAYNVVTDINGDVYMVVGEYGASGSFSITFSPVTLTMPTGVIEPMYLVKYAPNGSLIYAAQLTNGGDDEIGASADLFGNVYVGGDYYYTGFPFIIGNDSLSANLLNSEEIFVAKLNGCTGIIPSINIISTNTLQASVGTSYQWYLNGSLMPGQTSQFLNISQDGMYSVAVTDAAGCTKVSSTSYITAGPVNTSELPNQSTITLFPNPTTSTFTITSTDKIEEVKVYDILGDVIRNYELGIRNGNSATIDISSLSKGIYFAEIKDDKKNVVNRKVVVQ
jgi:hypothetical protein